MLTQQYIKHFKTEVLNVAFFQKKMQMPKNYFADFVRDWWQEFFPIE